MQIVHLWNCISFKIYYRKKKKKIFAAMFLHKKCIAIEVDIKNM